MADLGLGKGLLREANDCPPLTPLENFDQNHSLSEFPSPPFRARNHLPWV